MDDGKGRGGSLDGLLCKPRDDRKRRGMTGDVFYGGFFGGMVIRQYRNGDALKVLVQKAQEEEFVDAVAGFDQVGRYSLVDEDGDVLAVFGFALEGNVADCYALMAKKAGRYLLQVVRFLRKKMAELSEKFCISKMRMTVRTGFAAGIRFAELLGFHLTENLPRFYKEYDYQLFERIE